MTTAKTLSASRSIYPTGPWRKIGYLRRGHELGKSIAAWRDAGWFARMPPDPARRRDGKS